MYVGQTLETVIIEENFFYLTRRSGHVEGPRREARGARNVRNCKLEKQFIVTTVHRDMCNILPKLYVRDVTRV